jgi:protein ImuA
MHNVVREQRLAGLRTRIASIEKRPLLAEAATLPGKGSIEGRGEAVLRAPAGLLHEVFADEQRNGGAALGFAFGLARGLLTPARPAILFLQLVHDGGEAGLPYGPGVSSFGIEPDRLILGRLASPAELLWAVEEAVACRAVAAVVAEVLGVPRALDFTNSRRLALRAASGGASVLLVRYGQQREASAARLRWRISPAESQAPPFDARAPGRARWQVVLEKGRLGAGLMEAGLELWLDWTENGFQPAGRGEAADSRRDRSRPAAYGALPAALGDRLSQAG